MKINNKYEYEYIRQKILLPQADGTFKRKEIYARSEEELLFKIKQAQAEAEQKIERALNPTFKDVADEWIESHQKEISYYTYEGYIAPQKKPC